MSVSPSIIKTLSDREWVRVLGHRDVPGRPEIFGTTRQFLESFNLMSLDQLPPLSDIKDIDNVADDLFSAVPLVAVVDSQAADAPESEGGSGDPGDEYRAHPVAEGGADPIEAHGEESRVSGEAVTSGAD